MDTTLPTNSETQPEPEAPTDPEAPQPIPTPYALNDQGKPAPLTGVEPVFLTGTTVDLLGLAPAKPADGAAAPPVVLITVSKEKLLGDIQFRGAISDFHAIKSKIQGADYDTLVLRYLEDDIYGEGCNYEVALLQSAASTWATIITETERQAQLQQQAAEQAATAKRTGKVRRLREPAPWQSLGSEVEIQEHCTTSSRPAAKILLATRRRALSRAVQLGDKDAHELWSSSTNECRPFKDPSYDLRRAVRDSGVQAAAGVRDAAVQATGGRARPGAVQYQPRDMSAAERQQHLASSHFHAFLQNIEASCELALLQNEVTDILADELAALGDDDDAQQLAASATAAAGSGAALGLKERGLSEVQSFTDLAYSKGKVLSALQWVPHRRGVVAVACTEPASFSERIANAGLPSSHYILLWNFRDSIHPELVLEAPAEVYCFAFNPVNPDIVAAGCYNGQIVLWDMTGEWERVARQAAAGGSKGDDAGEEAAIPVVKHKFASAVEHSHNTMVADMHWLPGLEFGGQGRLQPAGSRPASSTTAATGAGAGTAAAGAAGAAGAATTTTSGSGSGSQQQQGAAGQAGSKMCTVLATTAADGKVLFWDTRVERLLKKGRRAEDAAEITWKASHSMHLLSTQGMDLQATRLCFDLRNLEAGTFYVGSAEGELVTASFIKPAAGANGQAAGGEQGGGAAQASSLSIVCSHCGPLVAVQRSPFLEDVLLTLGGWTFQIWREGDSAPLFVSPYAQESYTAGCWSPSRPGVLLLTDQSGGVEVWDLLDRSHVPVLRTAAASSALSSLSLAMVALPGSGAAALQLLAVGDSAGTLRILELPRSLRRQVHNEKKSMAAWVARAAAGVAEAAARAPARAEALKQVEAAAKHARDSASAAESAAAARAGGAAAALPRSMSPGPGGLAGGADSEEAWQAEYAALENALKVQLGLVQAAA